jgi:2-polyprenyl-6-methoxyphenol hydroxylase-like FAD-dependent oxidoreductase
MGWEAAQLLSQINTADDFYFDTCTQVKLPTWSKGRIALLGDAAYCASPLSGHGTTIAMVGAYVLAGELSRSGGDHRSAFALYESKFRPWVEEIQASALGQGKIMTPETALGIRFRGEVSRLSRFVPNKSVLYRGQIRMSNGFALEDYSAHRQPAL